MTTTTRRSPALTVTRLVAPTMLWISALYLAIAIAVFTVIAYVELGLGERTDESTSHAELLANSSPRFFLGSLALIVTSTLLAHYLPMGVTRRQLFWAGTTLALGGAAVAAAVIAGLFLVEWFVLDGTGIPITYRTPHLFDGSTQVGTVFLEHFIALAAFMVLGWLIGSVFGRYGGWGGLGLLLPCLLLGLLPEALLGVGWVGQAYDALGIEPLPTAASVPLGIAAVAVMLLLNHRLMRDMPLRRPTS
ncbi:hypothetical protein C1701_08275 [Actinoalloteichus sp. AHMU CJ021]|uniref:Uncharacterized protein n=1 Tax=Actinoalloteichus caeruleus DSM 43889 TaxID=1120930 RepID=A0ABT1JJT4_ACTCY|nr:hypothetical protein [Actinoalloteichus caeruleus]AUS78366.1 hypothetical protein C1701_08275 [Actinoalloteichus sp. AHMU CJ021]MCP2332444.1 hypothetical protein [Actinoalloteichus caeruleus DSM 43889]